MSAFSAHLEAYVEDYLPLGGREKEREIQSKQFQICTISGCLISHIKVVMCR